MTEMAVAVIEPEVVGAVPNITVVATDATAMAVSQARLTDWCDAKLREVRAAHAELEENLGIAKRNKWRSSALANAVRRESQRVTFYEKARAALAAGYVIIPNFDADVFAIRTSRNAKGQAQSTWGGKQGAINKLPMQIAEALPAGYADYESPTPMGRVYDTDVERNADGKIAKTTNFAQVTGFAEIDFPFNFAKSEILTATQSAMALRIFDEMGALPQSRRGDPMVVGRIRKPWMKSWQANNHVTFLVIWWLDTAAL